MQVDRPTKFSKVSRWVQSTRLLSALLKLTLNVDLERTRRGGPTERISGGATVVAALVAVQIGEHQFGDAVLDHAELSVSGELSIFGEHKRWTDHAGDRRLRRRIRVRREGEVELAEIGRV